MSRSNCRFALLALSALTPVTFYATGDLMVLRLRQVLAGKRRVRAISRIFEQGSFSVRALWELILVVCRAILDFVALPKTGRIRVKTMPPAEPFEPVAAPEDAPVKMTTDIPLLKNSTPEQRPQELAPSIKKGPDAAAKPKRCKPRKLTADRAAKLEQALKLLAGGQSRRAVAKTLGIAESTLRAWLKPERVACVPS
jgi:hypothetical protein